MWIAGKGSDVWVPPPCTAWLHPEAWSQICKEGMPRTNEDLEGVLLQGCIRFLHLPHPAPIHQGADDHQTVKSILSPSSRGQKSKFRVALPKCGLP